jgi:phosphatidylethanolamine/phosphatidyl-N-methylethanolamine N-methyltransferase
LGFFTTTYHRALERNISNLSQGHILEIGGGKGEHLKFVKHDFLSYTLLDVESDGAKSLVPTELLNKVAFYKRDARNINKKDSTYDRIICTCVLHHIPNVEIALQELRRVAKDQAQISIYLPCDPGMLYRWIRHWTSHRKQVAILDTSMKEVKYLWSQEHPNHYLGILSAIKMIFKDDVIKIRKYPIPWLGWNTNLFSTISIKIQK